MAAAQRRFGVMFAANLVPHVLRLDGVLSFDHTLVDRIEHEELIEHGSREEIEIRASALHAVELARRRPRQDHRRHCQTNALWDRGAGAATRPPPPPRSLHFPR